MGDEAQVTARWQGRELAGKALLETTEVIFRGGSKIRVVVPFASIRSISVDDEWLTLEAADGALALSLGAKAARWAEKIRHPRSRLDKLGVKPGMKLRVIDVADEALASELAGRAVVPATRGCALVLLGVEDRAGLAKLPSAIASLAEDGGLWLIRPKGSRAITETEVRGAAREAGLVDVKVAAFSATHTADKYVIPVARRGDGAGRRRR